MLRSMVFSACLLFCSITFAEEPVIHAVPVAGRLLAVGQAQRINFGEFEIFSISGVDPATITWDANGPDFEEEVPIVWFEAEPGTTVIGYRAGNPKPGKFSTPGSPSVVVYATGVGRAALSARGVKNGKSYKVATLIIEANLGPQPPPKPAPPNPPAPPKPVPPITPVPPQPEPPVTPNPEPVPQPLGLVAAVANSVRLHVPASERAFAEKLAENYRVGATKIVRGEWPSDLRSVSLKQRELNDSLAGFKREVWLDVLRDVATILGESHSSGKLGDAKQIAAAWAELSLAFSEVAKAAK